MKKILMSLALVFSFAMAYSQASFNFETTDHDFGLVEEGKDTIWFDFKFKNDGNEPIYISDVKTSCDCTLAQWPKDPIQPGKSGVIKGGFKIEGKMGTFEKSIIIIGNTTPAMNMLNIKGKIYPKGKREG